MTLHKMSAVALMVAALAGCSMAPQPLNKTVDGEAGLAKAALLAATPCCTSLAELSYQPLLEGETRVQIDQRAAVFEFAEGRSYVAAYRLPEQSGDLLIELDSLMGKSALVPQVLMLDGNHQVTRVIKAREFAYQPAKLLDGDRFEGAIYVSRQAQRPERFMVIYTPHDQLQAGTAILHPAKAFARAHSTVEPDVADPVIPHSAWGELDINVIDRGKLTRIDQTFKAEYADKVALSQGQQLAVAAPLATSAVTVAAAANTTPVIAAKPAPAMLSETDAFYQSQIEKAVTAGDINKAMTLVNEAERAGSTKAKTVFVEAVKRSQK